MKISSFSFLEGVKALSFFREGVTVITVTRIDAISGSTAVFGKVLNSAGEEFDLDRSGHDSGRNLEMIASTLSHLGAKWYKGRADGGRTSYLEVPEGEYTWKPCEAPAGAP